MATVGITTKPTTSQEWTGLNTLNQQALLVTMPENGDIYRLGGWLAGKDAGVNVVLCLWTAAGTLLRSTSVFTATGLSFGLNQSLQYEADITPYYAAAGTQLYVGWSRDPGGAAQWGYTSSGSHLDDTQTGSYPGSLAGFQSHGGQIGAYAHYSTNQAPTATPITGDWLRTTDTTPALEAQYTDPNGNNSAAYQVQIDDNRNFAGSVADIYDTGEVAWVAGNGAVATVTMPVLPRGSWLGWRFRFKDSAGAWSAWSSPRSIHINSLPVTSLSSPSSGALLTDTTPQVQFVYSDADGDSAGAFQVQVDNNSDFSSPLYDTGTVGTSLANGATGSHIITTVLPRGTTLYWRVRCRDAYNEWSAWPAARTFSINSLPVASILAPAASGLARVHNLGDTTEPWTLGGTHAKPRLEWSYSDANGHAQSAFEVEVSADGGSSTLFGSGEVASSVAYWDATSGIVMGTQYHWRVRVKDSAGEWSAWTAWSAFKVRWAQAIYEYAVIGGTNTSAWAFSSLHSGSGYRSFLFATATGAGGVGRSAWSDNLGSLVPDAYLNVMVRLNATVVGDSPAVTDMTFTYKGSAIQPDRWTFEPSTDWILDNDIRRFGTQSLRCVVSSTTGNRYAYPWRKVDGDDVAVQPNTDYTYSAFVKTDGVLVTGASVRLVVCPGGSLTPLHIGTVDDGGETSDSSSGEDGWQRLTLRFNSGPGTTLLRPMVEYVHNGTTAGDRFWVDALKLEEGNVATAWSPGFVGNPVVIDSNGLAVDGNAGGIFRLRGGDGGPRDVVELGARGLVLGGDVELYSPEVDVLALGDGDSLRIGSADLSNPVADVLALGDPDKLRLGGLLNLHGYGIDVAVSGNTYYIPDTAVPRIGAALMFDNGDTVVATLKWYRNGTFNRIDGAIAGNGVTEVRGALYSAGAAAFSIFLESNNAGARIGIKNNAGYGRIFYFLVLSF